MNEPGAGPSRTRRRKGGKRLWVLLAGLIVLLTVHVVTGLNPRFPGGEAGAGLPLDRCITEQAVLEFLDGKAVVSTGSRDAAGRGVETITLRKERISSLRIRSDDTGLILVRFNLDHEGQQYLVESSFQLFNIDSPELHFHRWNFFGGQVVSNR
jgi:hypothetical protein